MGLNWCHPPNVLEGYHAIQIIMIGEKNQPHSHDIGELKESKKDKLQSIKKINKSKCLGWKSAINFLLGESFQKFYLSVPDKLESFFISQQ